MLTAVKNTRTDSEIRLPGQVGLSCGNKYGWTENEDVNGRAIIQLEYSDSPTICLIGITISGTQILRHCEGNLRGEQVQFSLCLSIDEARQVLQKVTRILAKIDKA